MSGYESGGLPNTGETTSPHVAVHTIPATSLKINAVLHSGYISETTKWLLIGYSMVTKWLLSGY